MMKDRTLDRRLGRARQTRQPAPADAKHGAELTPAETVQRYIADVGLGEALKRLGPEKPPRQARKIAVPVRAVEAPPKPAAPEEKKNKKKETEPARALPWWEEQLAIRPRRLPPPPVDTVSYQTIHEYDPLEWGIRESEGDDER